MLSLKPNLYRVYDNKNILTVPPLVSPALWQPGSPPLEPVGDCQSASARWVSAALPVWQPEFLLVLRAEAVSLAAVGWAVAPVWGRMIQLLCFSERLAEEPSLVVSAAESGWPEPVSDLGLPLWPPPCLKSHRFVVTSKCFTESDSD